MMKKSIIYLLFTILCTNITFGACEVLITAEAKNHSGKGYPKQIKDVPAVWGLKENVAGGYVKLRITDASATQVEQYLASWQKTFVFDILQDTPLGYRIRVKVDPALISISGNNGNIKAELKNYVVDNYNANIVSHTATQAVLDVPRPVDLQAARADLHDVFSVQFSSKRYYFSSVDVDFALTQPDGLVERTKAQVLSMIKDKLDE